MSNDSSFDVLINRCPFRPLEPNRSQPVFVQAAVDVEAAAAAAAAAL